MNVNELLDTIEDTLEESTSMPLSGGKRLVDVEKVRDYLDDIRANLPGELRQAQQIVNDRGPDRGHGQCTGSGHREEGRGARPHPGERCRDREGRPAACRRDHAAAQSESRTLRQTVTDYCDNMLKTTEEAMVENAAQVKNVRANLRQNAKKNG